MTVCPAGADGIVVGEDAAEGVAEPSSRSRHKSSGAAHSLSVGAASTGGACRLVVQRSIHTPRFVCPEAGGGLRVCGPWSLASESLVVGANDGGEQEV